MCIIPPPTPCPHTPNPPVLSYITLSPISFIITITITHTHPLPLPGLLQFQPSPPGDGLVFPAVESAHITVNEEDGQIRLLVARAQGLLGRVMVGYRTTPFTASSPEDYEVSFQQSLYQSLTDAYTLTMYQ